MKLKSISVSDVCEYSRCLSSLVQLQDLSRGDVAADTWKELFIFQYSQITGRKIIIMPADHRSDVGDACFKLDFPFKPLQACT